ncbi:hypothetical protein GWI33_011953 [Rhynchophorus ferrugineus]|uniref:Uncharacterized protein n=1 Tax=Rhynchophorus ferrugineus TaxID=354439 RepID=A0A834J1F9_RHYFE|nr:hypothetical protein GWI33_011953 [Rhynchophorus ferrugineus]
MTNGPSSGPPKRVSVDRRLIRTPYSLYLLALDRVGILSNAGLSLDGGYGLKANIVQGVGERRNVFEGVGGCRSRQGRTSWDQWRSFFSN